MGVSGIYLLHSYLKDCRDYNMQARLRKEFGSVHHNQNMNLNTICLDHDEEEVLQEHKAL